ncbi:MAG: cupredoxin domain-containing protein [Sphingomicrobium sp.]
MARIAVGTACALAFGAPGEAVAAPKVHKVVIDKMRFGPLPANIHAGDTILWVNKDLFRHTATARDRSFHLDLAPGASDRTVIWRRGNINFFCVFHPGMQGRFVVAGK